MVLDEMQMEIDKATTAITICHYIEWFAELQRIKYAKNREEEIDRALKIKEEVLRIWNVDLSEIKEARKSLYDRKISSGIIPETLLEEDLEIPPNLLPNMIDWMRKKGISDADILECILYMCTTHLGSNK